MSRRVVADREKRQSKSVEKILDVFARSIEDRLGFDDIRKASGLSPKTVDKNLQRLIDEGILGKIPYKTQKNSKPYFSIGRIENQQQKLEEDYKSKLKGAYSCVSLSDRAVIEATQQHIESLHNQIPKAIRDLNQLDIYNRLKGEYFSAIYAAIEEIDQATDRAYRDHLEVDGLPKCSNCKYARWGTYLGKRVPQCTLNWNNGPRDYYDPDHSCRKFEWK